MNIKWESCVNILTQLVEEIDPVGVSTEIETGHRCICQYTSVELNNI